ncbi:MAG: CDP-diacylglycerol--glycerol-3-phosphate 3-phosphatidyltransferase [Candidatus Omnitrophota bacterium]|nr:MAG: CDP-diacylglycerol--glycerol-3-phosphate 3-phosphatidyltransferase [Candidatus Omnitrophota bacterium]
MNLPNKLSILRISLIPFVVICLLYYTPYNEPLRWIALSLFCLAILTDAVDGYIARQKKQWTELGSFLDPLADKFLINSVFVCLTIGRFPVRIPTWVTITVISRDLIIGLGFVLIYIITGKKKVQPNRLGKITTFFQMLTIILVLLRFPYFRMIANITGALTIASGLAYIRRESRVLNPL